MGRPRKNATKAVNIRDDDDDDDDDIQDLVDKAVQRAQIKRDEEDSGLISDETISELGESDDNNIEALDAFDIFTDVGEKMLKEGYFNTKTGKMHKGSPKYTIKKNGEFLWAKPHPYSWEKLQKEAGGGHYLVIVKGAHDSIYVRTQSMTLSDPIEDESKQTEAPTVQQPREDRISIKEMMLLMADKEEKARREARESSEQQMTMFATMMSNMTQMMVATAQPKEPPHNAAQDMMYKILEKQLETQNKLIERMNDKIEKISDKSSKKDDAIDALKLVSLLKESEKDGITKYKELLELGELKATEKLELLRDQIERDHAKGEDDDESLTKTIIKSLLPVIGQTVQGAQQARQITPAQAKPRAPVAAQKAPQAPPKMPVRSSASDLPKPIVKQTPPKQTPPKQAVEVITEKPKAHIDIPYEMIRPYGVEHVPEEKPEVHEGSLEAMNAKARIIELMRDKMVGWLTTQPYRGQPEIAANETISILEENKIGLDHILNAFPKVEDLLKTAHEEGLPKLADKWLNNYYAYFVTTASQVDRKSTTST